MSFDANSGAVRNYPVFVDAFVDAFHEAYFCLNFQRLVAGLSLSVVAGGLQMIHGEKSHVGPVLVFSYNQLIFNPINLEEM